MLCASARQKVLALSLDRQVSVQVKHRPAGQTTRCYFGASQGRAQERLVPTQELSGGELLMVQFYRLGSVSVDQKDGVLARAWGTGSFLGQM